MITFKDIVLKAESPNIAKMPFTFYGNSSYANPVAISAKGSCGCTQVTIQVPNTTPLIKKAVPYVLATEVSGDFIISGYLTKRGTKGTHNKDIIVSITSPTGEETITLKLSMNII